MIKSLNSTSPFNDTLRVCVIGGGTGSHTVLSGFMKYVSNLTAIVSMADDGGSTGRIRDEFGHLPPGDVRRCLLALSSNAPEDLMLRELFEYRFDKGHGLSGHSLGNLILTALTEKTGSVDRAIAAAGGILQIRGQVVPVTLEHCRLKAWLEDGTLIEGETNIDIRQNKPDVRILEVFLEPEAKANPDAIAALERADLIVIGPGDLYTSIVPNLLAKGLPEAIRRSKAQVVYVCNLMTKYGETNGFKASDFIREIQRYLECGRRLNTVILNKDGFPPDVLETYARENSLPVEADLEQCKHLVPHVIVESLASSTLPLRHDPDKLAQTLWSLVSSSQRSKSLILEGLLKDLSDRVVKYLGNLSVARVQKHS